MTALHRLTAFAAVCALVVLPLVALAQTSFPQVITDPAGTVVVYQPQPETLKGNVLTGRAAMSVKAPGQKESIFGAFWALFAALAIVGFRFKLWIVSARWRVTRCSMRPTDTW